jgi:hypothetical protein
VHVGTATRQLHVTFQDPKNNFKEKVRLQAGFGPQSGKQIVEAESLKRKAEPPKPSHQTKSAEPNRQRKARLPTPNCPGRTAETETSKPNRRSQVAQAKLPNPRRKSQIQVAETETRSSKPKRKKPNRLREGTRAKSSKSKRNPTRNAGSKSSKPDRESESQIA